MQFGVCCDPSQAAGLAAAGFEFIEGNVQSHLKPREDEASFAASLAAIQASPLPMKVANCFLPGDLKVTGPEVDPAAQRRYVECAFRRAAQAGIDTIVFGSGGARRIPDGFDRQLAWRQLIDFGQLCGPLAQACGVTVVVEPLNRHECNVLTAVGESADYVRAVDHPAVRLLVDAYHWYKDDDRVVDLVAAGSLLRHAHIATRDNRRAPSLEPFDFSTFFQALAEVDYAGRLSVEAGWNDMAGEAAAVLAELRRWAP